MWPLFAPLWAASDLGLLGGGSPSQPPNPGISPEDMRAAAAKALAAKMRQQTPTAPVTGDSFDERFTGDSGNYVQPSGDVPLPKPRPDSATAGDNSLDNLYLSAAQNQPQPAAQPVSSTAPTSSPSFGDRAVAALANFGAGGRAGGLFGALTGAIEGGATGQRFDPMGMQNQTVQALVGKGIDPSLAQIIARDPASLNQMLPILMGVKPWSIQKVQQPFGGEKLVAVNPLNPSETMTLGPNHPQPAKPQRVKQGPYTYDLQPDGTYKVMQ